MLVKEICKHCNLEHGEWESNFERVWEVYDMVFCIGNYKTDGEIPQGCLYYVEQMVFQDAQ